MISHATKVYLCITENCVLNIQRRLVSPTDPLSLNMFLFATFHLLIVWHEVLFNQNYKKENNENVRAFFFVL